MEQNTYDGPGAENRFEPQDEEKPLPSPAEEPRSKAPVDVPPAESQPLSEDDKETPPSAKKAPKSPKRNKAAKSPKKAKSPKSVKKGKGQRGSKTAEGKYVRSDEAKESIKKKRSKSHEAKMSRFHYHLNRGAGELRKEYKKLSCGEKELCLCISS